MRLLRVELESFEAGNIPAVVPVDDLTVIIGRNGVGKSLALEAIRQLLSFESVLERRGRGDRPVHPYGWLHVRLDLSPRPGNDWEWFRPMLARGVPSELGSDIPDIVEVVGGPEHFADPEDYGYRLEADGVSAEYDQSWEAFIERAVHTLVVAGECNHVLATYLLGREELDVAIQLYPGGPVEVVTNPEPSTEDEQVVRLLAQYAVDADPGADTVGARVARRLLEPIGRPVRTLRLGALPEDDRYMRSLLERLPRVIYIGDRTDDPEPIIDKAIERLLPGWQSDRWLEDAPDGTARIRPEVYEAAKAISSRASLMLPPFISQQGSVEIVFDRLSGWRQGTARCVVRLRFGDRPGDAHFVMLGAGTRRWVAASLVAACGDVDAQNSVRPMPLYLIDEPELHLHPTAQADVLRWIEDRVAAGSSAVLTTHSPIVLDVDRESAHLLALVRHGADVAQVDITTSVLDDLSILDGLGSAVGADRVSALHATRGFLVVEGEHDRLVVRRFFGPELDRARIRILPLRGSENAMALGESEFFASLGMPLCVLFDNVRPDRIVGELATDDWTSEERKLRAAIDAFTRLYAAGHLISAVEYTRPDIICSIPIDAARRAFPTTTSDIDWQAIERDWRSKTKDRPGFKSYALQRLGLRSVKPDDFVAQALQCVRTDDKADDELNRAITTAMAVLRNHPRPA